MGSPDKTVEKADSGTLLIGASAEDPLQPHSPNDYAAFWMTFVPKLAKANQDIPAHKVKELSRSAMAESGNDAIQAYVLLSRKIEVEKTTAGQSRPGMFSGKSGVNLFS